MKSTIITIFFITSFLECFTKIYEPEDFKPKVIFDEEDLKKRLTVFEYWSLRERHVEARGEGEYYNHTKLGTYNCKVCTKPLFSSYHKVVNNFGYAVFTDTLENVAELKEPMEIYDNWFKGTGLRRLILYCENCGSFLGIAYVDPEHRKKYKKTYHVNSVALNFELDLRQNPELYMHPDHTPLQGLD